MTRSSTFIGIDVAKARPDWLCQPQGETFSVSNDAAGIEALVERLHTFSPVLIVLEATGNYQIAAVAALVTANLPVAVTRAATAGFFKSDGAARQDGHHRRGSTGPLRRSYASRPTPSPR